MRYVDYYFHEDKAGTPGQFDQSLAGGDDAAPCSTKSRERSHPARRRLGYRGSSRERGTIGAEAAAPDTTAPEA